MSFDLGEQIDKPTVTSRKARNSLFQKKSHETPMGQHWTSKPKPVPAMFVIPGCEDEESYGAVVEDAYTYVDEAEPTPLQETAEQLSQRISVERQAGSVQEK